MGVWADTSEHKMEKLFSRRWTSGLLAAGLLACLASPLAAAPLASPSVSVPPSDVTTVRDHRYGDSRYWKRWPRHRTLHRSHRHYDNWRWRNRSWHHHHHRPRIYSNFGLIPNYDYIVPRRHYRAASSAHVRWCYNRYRSYRAWDNSWQPYNGPRRQCRSPYY